MKITDFEDYGPVLGSFDLGYSPRTREVKISYYLPNEGDEATMLLSRVLKPADINNPMYELKDRAEDIILMALLGRRLKVAHHKALVLKCDEEEVRILVIRKSPSEAWAEVVFDLKE